MKALLIAVLLLAWPCFAEESDIHLKEAPGKALVEANCSMCHSLDYIPMNSPILDRKGWEATVNKMIKGMGAPVAAADVQGILDYLASQYGK
jgi:cytochrome c5